MKKGKVHPKSNINASSKNKSTDFKKKEEPIHQSQNHSKNRGVIDEI